MFSKLFKRKTAQRPVSPTNLGRPEPEKNLAVIGDVHGRRDLLQDLLDKPEVSESDVVIAVGDFVDRGEESAQVLSLLQERNTNDPDNFICLMGNHEKMMLDFLDRPTERGARWLRNGGLQTLASYGVGGVTEGSDDDEMITARNALRDAMPDGQEDWIRNLPLHWHSGNLWVVHGAVDPTIPMTAQNPRTLLWGNGAFMRTPRQDGVWVAHGHTVTDFPEMKASRIAVDTGAYFSGTLTAALIPQTGEVSFCQATR